MNFKELFALPQISEQNTKKALKILKVNFYKMEAFGFSDELFKIMKDRKFNELSDINEFYNNLNKEPVQELHAEIIKCLDEDKKRFNNKKLDRLSSNKVENLDMGTVLLVMAQARQAYFRKTAIIQFLTVIASLFIISIAGPIVILIDWIHSLFSKKEEKEDHIPDYPLPDDTNP